KSTDIPGLVFEGGKLYLASNDYGTPATVFLAYDAGPKGPEPWAILTIAGDANVDVEIHALRFWLDARQSNTPIAAVLVRKKGGTVRVTFEDCEFIQGGWPESVSQRRLGAVLVDSSGSQGTPTIEFRKCCFRSGHDAVTAHGPARIIATDCAFGPHDALFRLRGTRRTPDSTAVTLRNCSALLRSGAAFELEDGVSARLSVSNSIFSAPNGKNGDSPVLIRQTGDGSGFYYNYNDGRSDPSNRNVYHNLAAYVAKFATASASTASARVPTLAAFRQEPRVGESDASLELDKKSPWRNPDPLTLLEPPRPGALNVRSPKDAFLLDVTEPRVRQVPNADDPEKIVGVVGVEDCIWGRLYDPDDLRGFKPPVASKTKIVDQTLTKTIGGRYPSIAQ